MIVVGLTLLLFVSLLARRFLRGRAATKLARSPLAGFDTGARSPYRTPRGVRFHKGL